MNTSNLTFSSKDFQLENRAFLLGDVVLVTFFLRNGKLILAEEVYFFLMASMRKMRMKIPMDFTLDFFQNLLIGKTKEHFIANAYVKFHVFRNQDKDQLQNAAVSYYAEIITTEDVLALHSTIKMDMIKEISVGNSLLSSINVHSAENIYAEIYAKENDLDDLILLNSNKRIARSIYGNIVLLKENVLKVVKHTEGAYISPLLESFITFVHKNKLAEIEQTELIAFETQKADEILIISDQKGFFPVAQIRTKNFNAESFKIMLDAFREDF